MSKYRVLKKIDRKMDAILMSKPTLDGVHDLKFLERVRKLYEQV